MTAIATKRTSPPPLVPASDMEQIIKLDQAAKAASSQLVQAEIERNDMAKGMIMARAMKVLRELMTDKVMADAIELMNTPLGFKTDRPSNQNPSPYSREIVRDVLVQALIRGLRPTGNEINIIAGNLYVTREGFERLLREFPGLKNLSVQIGVPVKAGEDGAVVPCKAAWEFNGEKQELICEGSYQIPIRVNKAMGVDAIQGKARSKIYRRIYERLTGTTIQADADAGDLIEGEAEQVDKK